MIYHLVFSKTAGQEELDRDEIKTTTPQFGRPATHNSFPLGLASSGCWTADECCWERQNNLHFSAESFDKSFNSDSTLLCAFSATKYGNRINGRVTCSLRVKMPS
jgi:hypothetical protein